MFCRLAKTTIGIRGCLSREKEKLVPPSWPNQFPDKRMLTDGEEGWKTGVPGRY